MISFKKSKIHSLIINAAFVLPVACAVSATAVHAQDGGTQPGKVGAAALNVTRGGVSPADSDPPPPTPPGKVSTNAVGSTRGVVSPQDGGGVQPGLHSTATLASQLPASVRGESLAAGAPIHVTVGLKPRDQQALDQFVSQVLTPGNPSFRHFMSAQQTREHFSPTQADAQRVADYLTANGFTHVTIAKNRMLVTADGTAATARRAFNTDLVYVNVDGERSYTNVSDAMVPASLGGIVNAVLGLSTAEKMHSFIKQVPVAKQQVTTNATKAPFNATQFPLAYDLVNSPVATSTTVGIITEGNVTQSVTDLHTFESRFGLPTINPTIVTIGTPTTDTSGVLEWDLDSQSIQAMAGGQVAEMIFYVSPSWYNDDITSAINEAVIDNVAQVINVSLGECERSAASSGMTAITDVLFEAAVAQGQTFSVSSGDSGSHECSALVGNPLNTAQSYPAVSPYVVAVGGTSLYTNADGTWANETVWSGAGGGPARTENKPVWQRGIVSSHGRGVPDVSLDADPYTGELVVYYGGTAQVGGTSLAAPLFAGMWARMQTMEGNTLGMPGPSFYGYVPTNSSLVHDVVSGDNSGPVFSSYTATVGWDFASGFGSPVGSSLASFIDANHGF